MTTGPAQLGDLLQRAPRQLMPPRMILVPQQSHTVFAAVLAPPLLELAGAVRHGGDEHALACRVG